MKSSTFECFKVTSQYSNYSSYSQVAFLILKMQLEDLDAYRSYAQVPFPTCNLILQD